MEHRQHHLTGNMGLVWRVSGWYFMRVLDGIKNVRSQKNKTAFLLATPAFLSTDAGICSPTARPMEMVDVLELTVRTRPEADARRQRTESIVWRTERGKLVPTSWQFLAPPLASCTHPRRGDSYFILYTLYTTGPKK